MQTHCADKTIFTPEFGLFGSNYTIQWLEFDHFKMSAERIFETIAGIIEIIGPVSQRFDMKAGNEAARSKYE